MTDKKKEDSWYDIWQNWMTPELKNSDKPENHEKDKIDDWYEIWSSWMAPDILDNNNKKDDTD